MAINDKLRQLATLTHSADILVYMTSDKQPGDLFPTKIAIDVLPIFYQHLKKIGKQKKLSLYLYSTGGQLEAPWPLVSLIREYCDLFEVIVPFKALSAGTLIALGADKIIMTPMSYLSPIDPQGNYEVQGQRRAIQVEDVTGFVNFAKNKVGINEQGSLSEIMKMLSVEVPPSVLGSINRTHSLIRLLATNLLKRHKVKLEDHQIKSIVETLTEKLFSHSHLINRCEAKKQIGFKKIISYASTKEEGLINDIYDHYVRKMQIDKPFKPDEIVGAAPTGTLKLARGVIKSSTREDNYITEYTFTKNTNPGIPQPYAIAINDHGWEKI